MARSTAKVATALRHVAIQMTSKPRMVGPDTGACCMVVSPPSNLEIDHFGHDETADAHPDEPADAGDHQALVGEEGAHIFGVDEPDHREHHEWQRANDVCRGLRLRAHRTDFQLHLR